MWCFFFKQKTAYDVRISDWSSDVCSSDLPKGNQAWSTISALAGSSKRAGSKLCGQAQLSSLRWVSQGATTSIAPSSNRSEEHTSELQSLMRISYAVFCLKKKKQNKQTTR